MSKIIKFRFEWADKGKGHVIRYRPGKEPDEWEIDKVYPHPYGGRCMQEVSDNMVGFYGAVDYIETIISIPDKSTLSPAPPLPLKPPEPST